MNLTDDEILKFQKGCPVFLDDICAVYPATVGEIVDLGYSKFKQYINVILTEKPISSHVKDKEMQDLLLQITDFQYLLMLTAIDKDANALIKEAFHFFTHENVFFSLDPAQIVVGPMEEKHLMTEDKFYEFQRLIKRMYFIEQEAEEIIIHSDDTLAVRKLKEQMRANRERVRKAKEKQAAREKSDLHFSDLIGTMTLNHCNVSMVNVWDMTYYAFHEQLKRMGWRDQFNINHSAAIAGAKLKKSQLKHWMRSIASSDKN